MSLVTSGGGGSDQYGWQSVKGRTHVPLKRWVHLAFTYDSATGAAYTYIDGKVDSNATLKGGALSQKTANVRLGQDDWGSWPHADSGFGSEVDGKVDSVRISNVSRSFLPISRAPSPPPPSNMNLVPNGDFEMGMVAGWRSSGYGDATLAWQVDEDAHTGSFSLTNRIDGASTLPIELMSRPIPVVPGTYTWSAWVRAQGSALALSVVSTGTIDDFRGRFVAGHSGNISSSWEQLGGSFTITAEFDAPSVCVLIRPPAGGQVWIDDVLIISSGGAHSESSVNLAVSVGFPAKVLGSFPPANLFPMGKAVELRLSVANLDIAAHDVTVIPMVVDYEHTTAVGQPIITRVGSNSTSVVPYSLPTAQRGTFLLRFNISVGQQSWIQPGELHYAIVMDLMGIGDASKSLFAMNTHMEREPSEHTTRFTRVLAMCGVKWIRAWWGWGMCERQPGQYDYTEFERQYSAVSNGTGMEIMPILLRYENQVHLSFPPYNFSEQSWAGPVPPNGEQCYPYPSEVPAFGVWAGKVAAHFKGRVKAYEM